ncbi:MAG: Ig-like domain-containing protein, partial [Pirellulaceae bacterium]
MTQVQVSTNGGSTWNLASGTTTWTYTSSTLTAGTYSIAVRATDNLGNTATINPGNVIIDTTAPVVTVTSLTTGDTTPAIGGTITEASAISSVTVTVDGVPYTSASGNVTIGGSAPNYTWSIADGIISPLANGTYNVAVSATDTAGNIGTDSSTNDLVVVTVPGAPTAASAVAGNAQATVSWTAPASNGGSAITSYTATSSPGGLTCTSASSPCTVTGLTNGTGYRFVVTAANSSGNSTPSSASKLVTPLTVSSAPQSVSTIAGIKAVKVSWAAP